LALKIGKALKNQRLAYSKKRVQNRGGKLPQCLKLVVFFAGFGFGLSFAFARGSSMVFAAASFAFFDGSCRGRCFAF
jgi:hypothetical protein